MSEQKNGAPVPCPTVYPSVEHWNAGMDFEKPGIVEKDVPCGGTLRECEICHEVAYCGREGRCTNDGPPAHWVQRRFNIEGVYGEGIVGWTRGERWNGWACPRFEHAEALQVIAWNSVEGVGKAWLDEARDTVCVEWDGQDDEDGPQEFVGEDIETLEGTKHVYPIGAGAWVWDAEPLARLRDRPMAEFVAQMQREILDDIREGRVPVTVRSFVDLQDHVDANEYGGTCTGEWSLNAWSDADTDYINAAQGKVDAWLKAGGHRPPTVITEDSLYIVLSPNGDCELLDGMPQWDWVAAGQTVRLGNVNGGDSIRIEMPAENRGR